MRVVVIGASGQLGRALTAVFRETCDVIEAVHRDPRPGQQALDLADHAKTMAMLDALAPDLVLVAGAMCNVDRCELEPDLCREINVEGPRVAAEYARGCGARIVLYSTDHVFDSSDECRREDEPVQPINTYSRSKANAEVAVRAVLPDRHLILRTSGLYGPDAARRNFVLRLIDRARSGERVAVPADQWGSPTYTDDLALATRSLVEWGRAGTFHATGPECVDRVSFARRVCARFGLDTELVDSRTTIELGQAARRPLRVCLDCRKLRDAGVPAFRGIDAGLEALAAWQVSQSLA